MRVKLSFLHPDQLFLRLNLLRWILLIGLAASGYALLLAWQADYGNGKVEAVIQSQSTAFATAAPATPAANDLPVMLPSSSVLPATADLTPTNSAEFISVETDTLQVQIDLRGGDITQAALVNYPVSLDKAADAYVLLRNNQSVYVAQSGVLGVSGQDLDQPVRPLFKANQAVYRLQGDSLDVPMTLNLENGLQVEKVYRFYKNQHQIEVIYRLHNLGTTPWQGSFFGQLKRDDAIDSNAKFSGFSLPTYLGAAYWKPDHPYNKLPFKQIAKAGSGLALNESIPGGWLAIVQHYFIAAWIPNPALTYNYSARRNAQGENIIGFTSPMQTVGAGQSQELKATLYVGPKLHDNLAALSPGLDLAIDYGFLFFISYFLVRVLIVLHDFIGNWGWSIVLLTCMVKLIFFYPSAISYRSMAKMRLVQPKMARLKEQFGEDRQRFSQEMIKLYKQEKINPISGCLPMLLQMPVFFALYWALMESVQLRHAPFILWIKDLSAMDPYFILPLIMGGSMFVQMKLNPAPTDPMQAKVMQFMPIMFTALFLFFPAGLVLYWITNNVLSIAQQWVITRRLAKA